MDKRKLICQKRHDRRSIIFAEGSSTIATVTQDGHEDGAELVKRWNEYPDLLAALEAIEDLPVDDNGERVIPSGFLDQARAAIAKAEQND